MVENLSLSLWYYISCLIAAPSSNPITGRQPSNRTAGCLCVSKQTFHRTRRHVYQNGRLFRQWLNRAYYDVPMGEVQKPERYGTSYLLHGSITESAAFVVLARVWNSQKILLLQSESYRANLIPKALLPCRKIPSTRSHEFDTGVDRFIGDCSSRRTSVLTYLDLPRWLQKIQKTATREKNETY